MKNAQMVSVIVPCYNEADNIPVLIKRLSEVLSSITAEFEVILVDDGSTDKTAEVARRIEAKDPRVRFLRFSRNFGKEAALSAGLAYARGDAVIPMDADLQHPPEVIAALVRKWQAGAKIVDAVRSSRDTDGLLRRSLSRLFYGVFNFFSHVELPADVGDFRLLDRQVVEALNRLPEKTRFMKGLFSWIGFEREKVEFEVADRHAGESSFGITKLFMFSFDGLVSFSISPLRIATITGLAMFLIGLFFAIVIIIRGIFYGVDMPGFMTTILFIVLIGGIQMLLLGVIGEYIGKIMLEVKARPLYVVAEEIGFENDEQ